MKIVKYFILLFVFSLYSISLYHIILTIASQILNNAQLPLNIQMSSYSKFLPCIFCYVWYYTADMEMVIFMIMSVYYDDKHCVWIFHYIRQKRMVLKKKTDTHAVIVLLLSFPKNEKSWATDLMRTKQKKTVQYDWLNIM